MWMYRALQTTAQVMTTQFVCEQHLTLVLSCRMILSFQLSQTFIYLQLLFWRSCQHIFPNLQASHDYFHLLPLMKLLRVKHMNILFILKLFNYINCFLWCFYSFPDVSCNTFIDYAICFGCLWIFVSIFGLFHLDSKLWGIFFLPASSLDVVGSWFLYL